MRHWRAMRQTPRSLSLGAGLLSLWLGGPALAQVELATGAELPTAQLIGWSQDEQRYAFRTYAHVEWDDTDMNPEREPEVEKLKAENAPHEDADGFCKGYLDHKGKRFRGALRLVVFEGDKKLMTLPIQDEPRCTTPEVAATRLGEAKKKLAELGIDLGRPGKDLPLVAGKKVDVKPEKQPAYALEYVSRLKEKAFFSPEAAEGGTEGVEPTEYRIEGTLELFLNRAGKKQKVFSQKVKREYTKMMGGFSEQRLASVHVSPSGERVVVLGASRTGGMRDPFVASLTVESVLQVSGAPIAKGK